MPITRIIVFRIRESRRHLRHRPQRCLPASLNRYGYLKRISLSLHRNYIYAGGRRSYLSAACDAPAGFPGATFPFAHASMSLRRRPHPLLDPDPQLQGRGD